PCVAGVEGEVREQRAPRALRTCLRHLDLRRGASERRLGGKGSSLGFLEREHGRRGQSGEKGNGNEAHSKRNASMGSKREALRAGYRPKTMPTSALKTTEITMTSGRTSIGQPNCSASFCPTARPRTMPMRPP